jgi:hypothetical protein
MKRVDQCPAGIFRINVWIAVLVLATTSSFAACGASKKTIKPPSPVFEFVEATLSRDIEKKGKDSVPIGRSTVYYTNDTEVISRIKMANISGKHKIRWDWHKPDGSLYYSTGNLAIRIPSGKYRKEMSLWHRISLYGEPAVDYPGRWLANIFVNDDVISSHHFEIKPEINIDKLPDLSQTPNADIWGLIIGIENYSKLPAVDYAEKDARLVQRYFNNILGVPEENIITLIDSQATKGKIEGILRSYLPLNLDKNSTLFVYFAGHGVPSLQDGDAFIVTYDGEPRFIEYTGYKLKTLYADIAKLPAKRSIVFIDGCFSGASSRSGKMLIAGSRPALLKVETMTLPSDKIISLTASQGDQLSNAYPEKEHGLFTYYLLSGLRGAADADSDKVITLDELYAYVKVNVVKVSRRAGLEQTPEILPGVDVMEKIKISKAVKE